jgi:hypothetical protein
MTGTTLTRRTLIWIGLAVASIIVFGVLAIVLLAQSPGGGGRVPAPQRSVAARRPCLRTVACGLPAHLRFFAPTSIWNAAVPADAPLDPHSRAIVGTLLRQEAEETIGVATTSYGVPIYTVGRGQTPVHVTLDQAGPVALQHAFDAVPLPTQAVPAAGTDGNLAVYQPSTDTMWEFWRLSKQANGWHAAWGGRMVHVSTDPGYYRNVVNRSGGVLEQPSWGAPATSFPLVAGVMTIAELRSGRIDHALALAIGHPRVGAWAWPAQRSDGDSTDPSAVPEGAHFRLDPKLDLASLALPHFVLVMARAAQRYGIIINNRSAGFSFRAEDPRQFDSLHGYNPYMGRDDLPGTPGALFDEWPSVMLRRFPWSHLQLLKMSLRTRPDSTQVVEG